MTAVAYTDDITTFITHPSEIDGTKPLTPNDDYSGRTAPLTSKRCILYIYSDQLRGLVVRVSDY